MRRATHLNDSSADVFFRNPLEFHYVDKSRGTIQGCRGEHRLRVADSLSRSVLDDLGLNRDECLDCPSGQ